MGIVLICLDYGLQEGNATQECDLGREEPLQHAREWGGGRPWVSAPGHGASARRKAPVTDPRQSLAGVPSAAPCQGLLRVGPSVSEGAGHGGSRLRNRCGRGLGPGGRGEPLKQPQPASGPPILSEESGRLCGERGRHWMEKSGEGTGFRSVVSRSDCRGAAQRGLPELSRADHQ